MAGWWFVFYCVFITVIRKVPFEEVIFMLRHQLSEGMSLSDTERRASRLQNYKCKDLDMF